MIIIVANIDTYTDWGYAEDYARNIFLIIEWDYPDYFIFGIVKENHIFIEFGNESFKVIVINLTLNRDEEN